MKKYFLYLLPFILIGCEKQFDGVVVPTQGGIQTLQVSAIDSVDYTKGDSVVTFSISFASSDEIKNVYFNIINPDGDVLNPSPVYLLDDGDINTTGDSTSGDNNYSNKFTMSINYQNGTYKVNYYVTDEYESSFLAANQFFIFDNGKERVPPVLSNLTMPDEVNYDELFTITIMAVDSNGQNDIFEVYYRLFRPDGSQVINSQGISEFPLFDDGNTLSNGDQIAGDSIYTVFLTFPTGQPLGTWRFEFEARDKGNLFSNVIMKNLNLVQ